MDAERTLRALVDRLIPADEYPSGWQAGVGDFIRGILAADLKAQAPLVEAGLDLLDREARARHDGVAFAELPPAAQDGLIGDLLENKTTLDWGEVPADEFMALLVRLAAQGFYSDPHNGGNRDAVSWRMVGYRILPEGLDWPAIDQTPRTTPWEGVDDAYEVVVVGAGAGGGVAACVLAEAGRRVLLVERGDWLTAGALRPDHLRNQRLVLGYETPAGPPSAGNPRVFASSAGDVVVAPTDARWHNNAMTLGGGTRVYGAMAFRFCPEDFRMASTYGVPPGSSMADWPISYADMEPYYDRAEWEIGVSGDPAGADVSGPRARGYPMPPIPHNAVPSRAALLRGARALGLATAPVPLLINSEEYNGRGGCLSCGACVGFGCPGEFKNGAHNTVIPRALATGRCDVLTGAQVEQLLTDAEGRVTGVALATDAGGAIRRREVRAAQVVLAAGAIETARLLLNSASAREPHGLGNNGDQVGRHLQGHVYSGAIGLFDEPVQDYRGPGPSIVTHDYRHHNAGIVGGGVIANDFVLTPIGAWNMLTTLGVIPAWGAAGKRGMRDLAPRLTLVIGPIQETPNPGSRVTVDPAVRDRFGVPVARLSGDVYPDDDKAARFLSDKAAEWLRASGARTVVPMRWAQREGPSGGQHQAGTCRMGADPASSVTDAWGRVWGHDNLHIADGSLHVTNGGVNPVLTILANAYRVSERLAAALREEDERRGVATSVGAPSA